MDRRQNLLGSTCDRQRSHIFHFVVELLCHVAGDIAVAHSGGRMSSSVLAANRGKLCFNSAPTAGCSSCKTSNIRAALKWFVWRAKRRIVSSTFGHTGVSISQICNEVADTSVVRPVGCIQDILRAHSCQAFVHVTDEYGMVDCVR